MGARIAIDRNAIADFCRRHRVCRLSLFGSVLRPDFDPERSDVDVLVQFEPGAEEQLTYFALARMRFELEELVGRAVDLSLASALHPYFRDEVLQTAEVQYDAA